MPSNQLTANNWSNNNVELSHYSIQSSSHDGMQHSKRQHATMSGVYKVSAAMFATSVYEKLTCVTKVSNLR